LGADGALARLRLRDGALLRIPPGVAHRFTAAEPTRALAFGSGSSPLTDREPVAPDDWPGRR
ncbi:MAG TPA: hypothetical protein VIL49_04175, partial [Capillimicrobium sp.]